MKERPILFSAPMVKAILKGRKTQTRRIMKLKEFHPSTTPGYDWQFRCRRGLWQDYRNTDFLAKCCPYGVVSDRLWVKESYADRTDVNWREDPKKAAHYCLYKADDDKANADPDNWHSYPDAWKSPRFMPRCLSRITLEITGVRVERLQAISHKDALAEGVEYDVSKEDGWPLPRYRELWNEINGPKSWDANPWVWVLEFQRVEATP